MIAGISQSGLIYWEWRRGSYRKDDCCQWLRYLLRQVHEPMSDVVSVCDNAPVHVSLESVLVKGEFNGALLLRLALYSTPLTPIGECWGVVKSVIKKQLNITLPDLLNTPCTCRNNTNWTPPAPFGKALLRIYLCIMLNRSCAWELAIMCKSIFINAWP